MNTITMTYYGVEGRGRNITEAKRDAGSKIEKAIEGTYEPLILRFHDLVGICSRHPLHGWDYTIVYPDSQMDKQGHIRSCFAGSYDTRAEAEQGLRRHIAQNVFNPRDPNSAQETASFILDERDRKDHLSWCEWHYKIQVLRTRGYDDRQISEIINTMGELERLVP